MKHSIPDKRNEAAHSHLFPSESGREIKVRMIVAAEVTAREAADVNAELRSELDEER